MTNVSYFKCTVANILKFYYYNNLHFIWISAQKCAKSFTVILCVADFPANPRAQTGFRNREHDGQDQENEENLLHVSTQ